MGKRKPKRKSGSIGKKTMREAGGLAASIVASLRKRQR